jgi:hypothetical protein
MSNKILIKNLKKVKKLESVGRPESSWVSENRAILMSQINPQDKKIEYSSTQYYLDYFTSLMQQKVMRPALIAVLVVGVYFGYSAVTLAAKASLPGEALYPVKVLSEKIQLATTVGDEGKVKLKMDFVSRRGDELQQLARKPDDDKSKSENISTAVKKITKDVNDVKDQIAKMATDSSASSIISTAKVIDEKTLKVEKDIIDVHTSLSTDVKKEVAKDVKEAIAKTEEVGAGAIVVMVNKSGEQVVKDANQGVTDKELTLRVSERIKNSEVAIEALTSEVNKIATNTPAIILSKGVSFNVVSTNPSDQSTTSANSTATLKEALKEVVDTKPQEAKDVIEEAKSLLDKKDYTSALMKVMESKSIVAEVIEKAPLVTDQIKAETASSTQATVSSSTNNTATTNVIR